MAELLKRHRRWAALVDETLRLDLEIDERKMAAKTDEHSDPDLAALQRRSRKAAREFARECEALKMGVSRRLEVIERGPDNVRAEAFPLLAILLDIALDNEIDMPSGIVAGPGSWRHLRYLVGSMMRLAPQVELTSLRRDMLPEEFDRLFPAA